MVPTGGRISATAEGDVGKLTFDWETTGSGDLLMFALPHHNDILAGASWEQIWYNSMKGDMRGTVGTSWTLTYPLTTITWNSPHGIGAEYKDEVKAALVQDAGLDVAAGDPYFGGKELSMLARLALIADEVSSINR